MEPLANKGSKIAQGAAVMHAVGGTVGIKRCCLTQAAKFRRTPKGSGAEPALYG